MHHLKHTVEPRLPGLIVVGRHPDNAMYEE